MTDNQKRPCCGAHVDSNDPCCAFREDELNAKMYAGWWAEATKERDEARTELERLRAAVERLKTEGYALKHSIPVGENEPGWWAPMFLWDIVDEAMYPRTAHET